MFNELPAEKAYRILESGLIVLVATRDADGRVNLMTMGFHVMMQHDPVRGFRTMPRPIQK